ncbi:hypothetical protein [Piscirickettsia litoralis]|uniref:Uncharacterized protein n=1 Tax=Piscirickettsia litoralis TaxID=1891921 RepID=A0ABX3A613_9GAMM|nr:hypothetical protein [Piscirickettsia litoralis]ODN43131.1 hypothetical protein BGC07_09675 [Piscirickettsia litoralis]
MTNFTNLENLKAINYSEMRINDGAASDKAIRQFVGNLNDFFNQFNRLVPTEKDVVKYEKIMQEVTKKINSSEYAYFLQQYQNEGYGESAGCLAQTSQLKGFAEIPARMQYWAASGSWGGSIRNPFEHRKAVESLQKWSGFVARKEHAQNDSFLFFQLGSTGIGAMDPKDEFVL